jgi:hypothetical protein
MKLAVKTREVDVRRQKKIRDGATKSTAVLPFYRESANLRAQVRVRFGEHFRLFVAVSRRHGARAVSES